MILDLILEDNQAKYKQLHFFKSFALTVFEIGLVFNLGYFVPPVNCGNKFLSLLPVAL